MRLTLEKKNRHTVCRCSPWVSFWGGALIGAAAFVLIYGVKILNVAYDGWLLQNCWYDLSQHYVGWELFRASEWSFPLIGLESTGCYPEKMSVIYTDSIPLVSIFFKLLSPVLPETFQFFGLYGLFCFAMQGGMAKLLLRRVLPSEWQRNFACVPFVLSAALIQRMYYHTALASHFLLLAGILLFVYRDKLTTIWHRIAAWSVLGMLCVSIHFTLYGIVSVMLLGFAVEEVLLALPDWRKAIRCSGGILIGYLLSTTLVFFLLGGFYGGISGSSGGLGWFSANLLTLFDPEEYSKLLPPLPRFDGQYEGLAYIGIASLIMMIIGLPQMLRSLKGLFAQHRARCAAVLFTGGVLLFVALSPQVTLGQRTLFVEPWPGFVWTLWGIFRSSGRFMWPITYTVILLSLYWFRKQMKGAFGICLILLVGLQVYEFSDVILERQELYRTEITAEFAADTLEQYAFPGVEHLQFMHLYTEGDFYNSDSSAQVIGYTQYAMRHGMTVSNFHFSRGYGDSVNAAIEDSMEKLKNGKPERDTLYVFQRAEFEASGLPQVWQGEKLLYTDHEVILGPLEGSGG